MTTFDPQTSIHIDPASGQITSGGAARNRRIAETGGQDKVQQNAYDRGYMDGYAVGFVEGHTHGAEEAYKRVEALIQKTVNARLVSST